MLGDLIRISVQSSRHILKDRVTINALHHSRRNILIIIIIIIRQEIKSVGPFCGKDDPKKVTCKIRQTFAYHSLTTNIAYHLKY